MKKWLIAVISVLLLLAVIVSLAMWNANGNLIDLIAGQSQPEPKTLQTDISFKGAEAGQTYTAQVSVDTGVPVNIVSKEYISFAIDSSQVVGGKWWNPAASGAESGSGTVHAPVFNFNQPRLDTMAQALAPAYLRIGGSEADKIYYAMQDTSDFQPNAPPRYKSVMTAKQWDNVNGFATRNGLQLVFTLNAGPASRKADGSWDGTNATELLKYTAEHGYRVALWELGNELNIFWFVHGLKAQISPQQYDKDLSAARALVKQYMPSSRFAGQGSAFWPLLGEPLSLFYGYMPQYLARSNDKIDLVSWHYYPQQSRRGPIATRRAFPSRLLDPKNLDEAKHWADQIKQWRDRYAPGKPIWLGETGNAQFGGEPGLSDVYLGGLWWMDQLGLLARAGHDTVVRQSLTGMNYGMIDDSDLAPRPDYWNSLLWKHLMGTRVYEVKVSGDPSGKLRAYAHSGAGDDPGSLTILLINLDHQRSAAVSLPAIKSSSSQIYEFTTPDIFGKEVLLNGSELKFAPDGGLPVIHGRQQPEAGVPNITLNPLSYCFVTSKQ
ncbi:MAG: glycoside hydrolase [Chloroflexi bacterium]|nr:glycoside hydrolase [Chloroflexota bacterium]